MWSDVLGVKGSQGRHRWVGARPSRAWAAGIWRQGPDGWEALAVSPARQASHLPLLPVSGLLGEDLKAEKV